MNLSESGIAALARTFSIPVGAEYDAFKREMEVLEFDLSDICEAKWSRKTQSENPYAKFLYTGIEAGGAALLGFEMNQPEGERASFHIVPFYGHTFNQDTWVPRAERGYFRMGVDTRFISSHSWLSSFLMHDDNFGANYCVPKNYLDEDQVRFVVSVKRPGTGYDGVFAEGMAIDILHSIDSIGLFDDRGNTWVRRALHGLRSGQIVLRSVAVTAKEYAQHLGQALDWENNKEDAVYLETIQAFLPKMVWIVEFSLPELFPANQRKVGELVLDANINKDDLDLDDFIAEGICRLIRLPGFYLMFNDDGERPDFTESPSLIKGHVDVFRYREHALTWDGSEPIN